MAKLKKKRNKKYRGEDAASTGPAQVTKISVPNRSKFGKWWYENKKRVRIRVIQLGVLAAIYLLIRVIF